MNNAYRKVTEALRFDEYESLERQAVKFEKILAGAFRDYGYVQHKRIGSSVTGTMCRGAEDIDYFVVLACLPSVETTTHLLECAGFAISRVTLDVHGYSRHSGTWTGYKFVVVPTVPPGPSPKTYVEDAFWHPEFIASRRRPDHVDQVLLTKHFFKGSGFYKKIKGISCELLVLEFGSFDEILQAIIRSDRIRVNFSPYREEHTDSKIVVDYPFVGRRSLSERIDASEYENIRHLAERTLADPQQLPEIAW